MEQTQEMERTQVRLLRLRKQSPKEMTWSLHVPMRSPWPRMPLLKSQRSLRRKGQAR